jgi:hypothetical protein
MNKSIYPFAPNQFWRNENYMKGYLSHDKYFNKEVLAFGNGKHLFSTGNGGILAFESNRYGYSNCRLTADYLGYPIVDKISDKLFRGMKPAGFCDPYSKELINLLLGVPFIPFKVIKSTSALNLMGMKISPGDYISMGNIKQQNTRTTEHGFYLFNEKTKDRIYLNPDKISDGAKFDICDFFVSTKVFTRNQEIGLVLLPIGSIVWFYDNNENKWTTASVNYLQQANNEICLQLMSVTSPSTCLLEIKGTELSVHKKLASLIQTDEIRIAARSFSTFVPNENGTLANSIPKALLINLSSNYSASIFDGLKMRIMGSSAFKNCPDFCSFAKEVANTMQNKQAVVSNKLSVDDIAKIKQFAVIAAKDNVPLFWGCEYLSETTNFEHTFEKLGYAFKNVHIIGPRTEAFFNVSRELVLENSKEKVMAECDFVVTEQVSKVQQYSTKDPVEVEIPKLIKSMGHKSLEAYVKKELESKGQLKDRANIVLVSEPKYIDISLLGSGDRKLSPSSSNKKILVTKYKIK